MASHEFRVRIPASFGGFAEKGLFPLGWIGEEIRWMEPREGQKFLRFQRPFIPDLQAGIVVTDDENCMWVPERLLESADPVLAR